MTSTDEDVPDLLEGLDRHQRRRAQGEATLSVLGTDLAFEAWAGRNDYQLVRAQPAALFRSVLEALFGHLRGRPVPERELFLERWAQWDTRASSSLVATMGFGEEGPREAFWPLLHEVRPPPAVLLDVRSKPIGPAELMEVISACLECPVVPMALVATPATIEALRAGPPSRARALLEEGLLDALEAASPLEGLPDDERYARSVARLRRDQAPPAVVQAFSALVMANGEQARSLAEALLYRLLEANPETAGRFHLNALQPWKFGPRRAELDLFCPDWSLAIEVDGYHHFQDQEAYRRDRRKDVELQLRDIFVARVLADDLVEDLGSTFDQLLETIRRKTGVGGGVP